MKASNPTPSVADKAPIGDHTPLPWEAVEGNECHGPYITTAFGTTVCDLYAMTAPSTRNGISDSSTSKPVPFVDADKNVHDIVRAVNCHDDMLADHKENARVLALVIHDLQGRIEGGKLAALSQCLDRSLAAIAQATGGE